MRLFKRKVEVIKVERFNPSSEHDVFDVSLQFLRSSFSRLFETSDAVYGLNDDGVFRFRKKGFTPTILEASTLSYEPTTTIIHTSFEGLCKIAEHYEAEIFELPNEYVICYPGLMWRAKKEKVKE